MILPHIIVFFSLYLAYCVVLGMRLRNWDYTGAGLCYDASRIAVSGAPHPLTDHVYLSITCFFMISSISVCWECGEIQICAEDQKSGSADNGRENKSAIGQAFVRWMRATRNRRTQILDFSASLPKLVPRFYSDRIQAFSSDRTQPSWINSMLANWEVEREHWLVFFFGTGDSRLMKLKIMLLGFALCQFPLHTYMIFSLRYSNEHRLAGDSENTWGFGQIVALILLGSTLLQSVETIMRTYLGTPEIPLCVSVSWN